MPQLPGINISVLRERTTARANEPLTVSGRVTAFGLPLLAAVRVFLEGPEHNPEVLAFSTLTSPLGDYSTIVIAGKDGRYQVYAQAFVPLIMLVPGAPDPVALGPPIAESPRPPLVIGIPLDGEVEFELEPGRRERMALPAPTPIEVITPVTFAPTIIFGEPAPGVRPPPPAPPFVPGPPEAPAPPVVSGQITGFRIE